VDLKFKSDYFPMERFANPNMIALIQGNTRTRGERAGRIGHGKDRRSGGLERRTR